MDLALDTHAQQETIPRVLARDEGGDVVASVIAMVGVTCLPIKAGGLAIPEPCGLRWEAG